MAISINDIFPRSSARAADTSGDHAVQVQFVMSDDSGLVSHSDIASAIISAIQAKVPTYTVVTKSDITVQTANI